MSDPRIPDPRNPDPTAPRPPYGDPAADPRLSDYPVSPARSSGRGGLIAAGIIAVLLVVALIAFSTGPETDPNATATIPGQEETMPAPAPAPGVAPADQLPAEQ